MPGEHKVAEEHTQAECLEMRRVLPALAEDAQRQARLAMSPTPVQILHLILKYICETVWLSMPLAVHREMSSYGVQGVGGPSSLLLRYIL